MKYYVIADIHAYYNELIKALEDAGFFNDSEPHKLIVLGDLMDRGKEASSVQDFIMDLMRRDEIILIKGNHEDLMEELAGADHGEPYRHHINNGTYDTALQLTGFTWEQSQESRNSFISSLNETPFIKQIIPAMQPFYETEHYIFTHGWIPCKKEQSSRRYHYLSDWRNADEEAWRHARWINGMDAVQTAPVKNKTVVCGHWHTSYGHNQYGVNSPEFGKGAIFTPFYAPGIIALDACTVRSGFVNCIVIDDSEIDISK